MIWHEPIETTDLTTRTLCKKIHKVLRNGFCVEETTSNKMLGPEFCTKSNHASERRVTSEPRANHNHLLSILCKVDVGENLDLGCICSLNSRGCCCCRRALSFFWVLFMRPSRKSIGSFIGLGQEFKPGLRMRLQENLGLQKENISNAALLRRQQSCISTSHDDDHNDCRLPWTLFICIAWF